MSEVNVEPSILTRDFNAPIQLIYEAWTQAKHLSKWQVPNAQVQCEYLQANIAQGGSSLHKMTMPNGYGMHLLTEYHELSPNQSIVFTQYQSNEQGDILTPMMPNWPKEIRATIQLSESNGVTSMEFVWQPINPTKEEAEGWLASRSQANNGWAGAFEMLAGYVENN